MRTGISITLKPADRRRLKALARDRNAPYKHVWRAEIVLFSADGVGTNEIMRRTGKSKTCVWRWQERFMQEGYDGLLRDKTRPSRIPPLGSNITERVVMLTQTDPPAEATHWTSAMMAKVVDISASSIQRIWRAHGLQPHRVKQFKLSTDPQFVGKLRDIVGLYVDPPAHAVVLSVDEKSQIQALDRTQPGLPMKKGRAGTMTRLQASWHDDTIRGPQHPRRDRHRPQYAAPPAPGVHPLPQCHRGAGADPKGNPRHRRQLRNSQASEGAPMAVAASALDIPLHTHIGVLAQRCRRLLRQAHEAAIETRRLRIGRRLASRYQSLRRRTQRRTETLHVDS
jgi:transposase